MELHSALTSPEEVGPLAEAGATEFYAGVLTEEWRRAYTNVVSGNRRSTSVGNLPSLEALGEAVELAHERRRPVHLALNLPYYTPAQAERLGRLMDSAAGLGVDGFIVADVPTMLRARREHPGVALHVSTIAPAFNAEAIRFYASLGASRVVLDRQLTVAEASALARSSPVDLEAFVMNGRCMNIDGLCTFVHGVEEATLPRRGRLGYALLHTRWAVALGRLLPRPLLRLARRLPGLGPPACMRDYSICVVPLGGLTVADAASARARMRAHFRAKTSVDCGACALRSFLRAGVRAAKVEGRDNDLARKLQDVRFLAALLREAGDPSTSDEELCRRTRERFRSGHAGECSDVSCYYREYLPGGSPP